MGVLIRCFSLLLMLGVFSGAAFALKPGVEVVDGAPLQVFNRTIFVFRGDFLGATPAVRANRARLLLDSVLLQEGELPVLIKPNAEGQLLTVGGSLAFVVTAADADPLDPQSPEVMAGEAARRLVEVVAETREARNVDALLKASGVSLLATGVFVFLLLLIARIRQALSRRLLALARVQAGKLNIGGAPVVDSQILVPLLRRLGNALSWVMVALLAYEWLSFVLSRFPYTRSWGEGLNAYLWSLASDILLAIFGALPGLGVALVIFVLARFVVDFSGKLLERLGRAGAASAWLSADTLPTTRRLLSVGVWLFAIAMAYPYLPGAQTEAFKGLSVLLGLMVSLGASSIVGQGAAGLILTYTGTIRVGEYVRIGESEGTVARIGAFTTIIRTGLGEELGIPNSLITGSVTKNYSRVVQGRGFVLDTTVTIGYDTPWRQVEAMLIEAALKTPGILAAPQPVVFQTALSDYYPEYRLVAQAVPSQPRPRAEVLSLLHANIQDVFNRYGVQIMSPHYMNDTETAKVVPPEHWYAAPAQAPGDASAQGRG